MSLVRRLARRRRATAHSTWSPIAWSWLSEAKGADLLLHEEADIDPELLKQFPRFKEITAHHTAPEEAGRIFSLARPKVAACMSRPGTSSCSKPTSRST